jgi:hypothetical protein
MKPKGNDFRTLTVTYFVGKWYNYFIIRSPLKTHNMFTESIVGYTAVDDHTYLAVVKNVLIQRIVILFICITIIALLFVCTLIY